MKSANYKLTEFFIIFIVVPICMALNFSIWMKLGIGITGFVYIIFVLLKVEGSRFKSNRNFNWKLFWKQTLVKLIGIAIITTVYMLFSDIENLFVVVLNKPLKWLMLLFFYSFFSVYPQELIYRTFYFRRYEALFSNQNLFLLVNAIVFSLAHLFFKNSLVIVLTFIGGLLFALTYKRTKSTLLVSIEHAIYGCWLFTVGMGEMLGFPS